MSGCPNSPLILIAGKPKKFILAVIAFKGLFFLGSQKLVKS